MAYADLTKAKATDILSMQMIELLLDPLEQKEKRNLLDGLHRFIL